MRLTGQQAYKLFNMGVDDINKALYDNGYTDDKVLSATLNGFNIATASVIYLCTYNDMETGQVEDCMIFVCYNKLFQLVADY